MVSLVGLQAWADNGAFVDLAMATLLYWAGAFFPQLIWVRPLGTAAMAIANLCLATVLGARWLAAGYFPLSNLYESLLFVAWSLSAVHLWVDRIPTNGTGRSWIGMFTAPVATGIVAFAALVLPPGMQVATPLVPALKSNWLMMHVSVMLLSYGALMVGSLLAIAFLVATWGQPTVTLQGNSLGTLNGQTQTPPHPQPIPDVPATGNGAIALATLPTSTLTMTLRPLTLADTLDNLSYRTIGLGFLLLTVGIVAGAVWANEAWGTYWSWDPKETWSAIVWLVFAAYLHLRLTKGWQGRKPAIVATIGLVTVWVCYLGVNFLGKGLHSYGWFL
ncbi:MAG: c-type cytochrome biogenesis protein CcsB [Pseudanabaenaceae cyanobacterium]